jgi:hypothetical protein
MTETFHGTWAVQTLSRKAKYEQFVIAGSDSSDGTYLNSPGALVGPVSGPGWTVTFAWKYPNVGTWQPAAVKKSAFYRVDGGLVVVLGADYDDDQHRDGDYADLVVQLTCQEPALTPMQPAAPPLEFTAPPEVFAAYRKHQGREPVHRPPVRQPIVKPEPLRPPRPG